MSPYPDEREVPDPPGRSVEIPEPIRAAAGLAVTMLDQARHLPSTITGLPVRMAGLAMQASLRLQQRYAGLVVKGDELLTQIAGTDDADPPWATFDDDVVGVADAVTEGFGVDVTAADDSSALPPLPGTTRTRPMRTAGSATRMGHAPSAFDLADDAPAGTPAGGAANGHQASEAPVPGYDAFTLAQLRARLRTFDAATLHGLLTYERDQRARAPYLTMLENRVTMLENRANRSRGQA
ncbi:MAG: lipid droplet-associated protein [Geodermatophilaceae bacterium]|jgi:hypothetical protein